MAVILRFPSIILPYRQPDRPSHPLRRIIITAPAARRLMIFYIRLPPITAVLSKSRSRAIISGGIRSGAMCPYAFLTVREIIIIIIIIIIITARCLIKTAFTPPPVRPSPFVRMILFPPRPRRCPKSPASRFFRRMSIPDNCCQTIPLRAVTARLTARAPTCRRN